VAGFQKIFFDILPALLTGSRSLSRAAWAIRFGNFIAAISRWYRKCTAADHDQTGAVDYVVRRYRWPC